MALWRRIKVDRDTNQQSSLFQPRANRLARGCDHVARGAISDHNRLAARSGKPMQADKRTQHAIQAVLIGLARHFDCGEVVGLVSEPIDCTASHSCDDGLPPGEREGLASCRIIARPEQPPAERSVQ